MNQVLGTFDVGHSVTKEICFVKVYILSDTKMLNAPEETVSSRKKIENSNKLGTVEPELTFKETLKSRTCMFSSPILVRP